MTDFQEFLVKLVREASPKVEGKSSSGRTTNVLRLVPDNAKQPAESLLQSFSNHQRRFGRYNNKRSAYMNSGHDSLTATSDHTQCPLERSNSSLFGSSMDSDKFLVDDMDSSFGFANDDERYDEFHSSFVTGRWETTTAPKPTRRASISSDASPSLPQRSPPMSERKTSAQQKRRASFSCDTTPCMPQRSPLTSERKRISFSPSLSSSSSSSSSSSTSTSTPSHLLVNPKLANGRFDFGLNKQLSTGSLDVPPVLPRSLRSFSEELFDTTNDKQVVVQSQSTSSSSTTTRKERPRKQPQQQQTRRRSSAPAFTNSSATEPLSHKPLKLSPNRALIAALRIARVDENTATIDDLDSLDDSQHYPRAA